MRRRQPWWGWGGDEGRDFQAKIQAQVSKQPFSKSCKKIYAAAIRFSSCSDPLHQGLLHCSKASRNYSCLEYRNFSSSFIFPSEILSNHDLKLVINRKEIFSKRVFVLFQYDDVLHILKNTGKLSNECICICVCPQRPTHLTQSHWPVQEVFMASICRAQSAHIIQMGFSGRSQRGEVSLGNHKAGERQQAAYT